MLLSKAIEGFVMDGLAGNYSLHTMRIYKLYMGTFLNYKGDCELDTITPEYLSQYIGFLRTKYVPNRTNGDTSPLSESAQSNHYKCLRAFFTWCEHNLELKRPDKWMPKVKYELPEVQPLTEEEIKAIFYAAEWTKEATTVGRRSFRMKRPEALRDKALLLVLLDTGIRVGELTRLRIVDVNLNNGEVHIRPYGSSRKSKPRTVYLGKTARKTMWLYINKLEDPRPEDNLFKLDARSVLSLLHRMGERANIRHVYPHLFRHTFAVQYLRNHGDVFTLQRLLGHSTLDMVKRYLTLADTDTAEAHRLASPADNWRL